MENHTFLGYSWPYKQKHPEIIFIKTLFKYSLDSVLESKDKLNENERDERENIMCEIFYVVFVRISEEIILEDKKLERYGTDGNQGHLFFVYLVGIIQSRQRMLK